MTPRIGVRVALGLTWMVVSNKAGAYDLMGTKWNDAEIPVAYTVNVSLSDDLPDADALAAIQMGFNAWNVLPCSSMRWNYAGRSQNSAWGADDGENVVTFLNDSWDDSGDALAITMTMWGGWGGELSDADIKFNGAWHQWAHFQGAPAGWSDATDIASVATHEVGHALGLNHSGVGDATMWPSVGSGDLGPRTLSADDIAGACAIYPTGQPEPAPMAGGQAACPRGVDDRPALAGPGEACGRQQACAAGLRCVSNAGENACAEACVEGACPDGFACAPLANGRQVCLRAADGLPGLGQDCDVSGRCGVGLMCLADGARRYCTRACAGDDCGPGAECVAIDPEGSACRLLSTSGGTAPPPTEGSPGPSGGPPTVGQACAFAPGKPACAIGLACVDTQVLDGTLVDPGYCTVGCDATHCCPTNWGCTQDLGGYGRCRIGAEDAASFACRGAPGDADHGPDAGVSGAEDSVKRPGGGGTFGCAGTPLPVLGLLLLARRRRPRHP